jgi:hypothetical protein
MNTPRGPVIVGGMMTREWRRFLETEGEALGLSSPPRTDPTPQLSRAWRAWLDTFGPRPPKEPLVSPDGEASREWRRYLEEI